MALTTNPSNRPDRDPDPLDPFHSLLLANPELPRTQYGPRNTKFWLDRSNGYRAFDSEISREEFEIAHHSDVSDPSLFSGVLMIEDIDRKAVSTLIDAFPDLELLFLHQHVAKLQDMAAIQAETAALEKSVDLGPPVNLKDSRISVGMHLDIVCSPRVLRSESGDREDLENGTRAASEITIAQSRSYRTEEFIGDGSTWRKASTRISCGMLTPELCMSYWTSNYDLANTNGRSRAHRRTLEHLARSRKEKILR
jgi:hypothetical protein